MTAGLVGPSWTVSRSVAVDSTSTLPSGQIGVRSRRAARQRYASRTSMIARRRNCPAPTLTMIHHTANVQERRRNIQIYIFPTEQQLSCLFLFFGIRFGRNDGGDWLGSFCFTRKKKKFWCCPNSIIFSVFRMSLFVVRSITLDDTR